MKVVKALQILASLILIAAVFGCTPSKVVINRIPFPEDEYRRLVPMGTAIVKGQAFLKTRGGDVKVAAGNEVLLNPVTTYSNQWYDTNYLQGIQMTELDPRIYQYVKKQTADGEGRFTFKKVPAGEYYLTTDVFWDAPVGYHGALVRQGGFVSKRITVNEGEEIEVIVTR